MSDVNYLLQYFLNFLPSAGCWACYNDEILIYKFRYLSKITKKHLEHVKFYYHKIVIYFVTFIIFLCVKEVSLPKKSSVLLLLIDDKLELQSESEKYEIENTQGTGYLLISPSWLRNGLSYHLQNFSATFCF